MNLTKTRKSLIFGAIILMAGVAVAFAHGGYGYRGHMMDYGPGYGGHMSGYRAWGDRGYSADLTGQQIAKIDQARESFYNDTREMRNQITDKRIELRQELNKDNPDAAAVTQLQKDLSNLESQFDQKQIEHQLEVRKIVPDQAFRSDDGAGWGGYCW